MQEDILLGLFFWILGFIIWIDGVWSKFENWLDKKGENFQKKWKRFISTVNRSLEEKKPGAEVREVEKIPLKIEIAIFIVAFLIANICISYENAQQYIEDVSPVIQSSCGDGTGRRPLLILDWKIKINGWCHAVAVCL